MIPFLSVLFLLPLLTHSALTHNGLPTGQTVAPPPVTLLTPPSTHPNSPFHTLHDHVCAHAPISRVLTELSSNLTRTVSAAQLSAIIAAAAPPPATPLVVLFHGGASCEWSRAIFPLWLRVAKRYRTLCFLALDARSDYVLNYNLMILGFPTVLRLLADKPQEAFRGNRTEPDLVAWVARVTGVAPMRPDVGDEEWLGEEQGVLDMRPTDNVNWTLVAANIVTALNDLYFMWKVCGGVRGRVWNRHAARPHTD